MLLISLLFWLVVLVVIFWALYGLGVIIGLIYAIYTDHKNRRKR